MDANNPALNQAIFAGVDVGGTKTLICLSDKDGTVVAQQQYPTRLNPEPKLFFEWLFGQLEQICNECQLSVSRLSGIGFGFPGVIDDEAGILTDAPALQWPELDIRPIINAYYSGPIYLDNDVNAAALGEHWLGAARNERNFIMITVGTGIGCALYLNGQLYKGADFAAGEVGHLIINRERAASHAVLSSDEFGPFERVASGTGIGALARQYLQTNAEKGAAIIELAEGQAERVETKHVFAAYASGDQAAAEILEAPFEHMSIAIANAVMLLNPRLIVLGGGVASAKNGYLDEIKSRVERYTQAARAASIVPAQLGNEAGAIGCIAAVLSKQAEANH